MCVVGQGNAGKSSLIKALSKQLVYVSEYWSGALRGAKLTKQEAADLDR